MQTTSESYLCSKAHSATHTKTEKQNEQIQRNKCKSRKLNSIRCFCRSNNNVRALTPNVIYWNGHLYFVVRLIGCDSRKRLKWREKKKKKNGVKNELAAECNCNKLRLQRIKIGARHTTVINADQFNSFNRSLTNRIALNSVGFVHRDDAGHSIGTGGSRTQFKELIK